MKKILLALTVFIVLISATFVWQYFTQKTLPSAEPHLSELKIGEHIFAVEIVDTIQARSQGLSGRVSLPENNGMLFIFPSSALYSFWMKGMRFPLDIIWISGDKVVGFAENALPDNSDSPVIYPPPQPIDKVLEINAGLVKKLAIKIGDIMQFNVLR